MVSRGSGGTSSALEEVGGRRDLLTPGLVAGPVLTSRAALMAGSEPGWIDSRPLAGATYLLDHSTGMEAPGGRRPLRRPGSRPSSPRSWSRPHRSSGSSPLGVETADLPLVPARPGSREIQWQLAGAPAVKMTVTGPASSASAESLFAAGVQAGTPAAALRLFREARPVARAVLAADGRTLQRGDAVEFYGYGMDTRYSGVAVYWLTAGAGQGRNMQVAPAAAEDAALAPSSLLRRSASG